MNYKKLYDKIVDNRLKNPLTDIYTENHHILPACFGGSDNISNRVKLSAREHFICHYLLTKIYQKDTFEWFKMIHAFIFMKSNSLNQNRYFNSRLYEYLKVDISKAQSIS